MNIAPPSPPETTCPSSLIIDILNHCVPDVMKTMVGMSPLPGDGNEAAPHPCSLQGVTGSIGLSGNVAGIVYANFPEPLAKVVAEKTLGAVPSDQDIVDVVAELTNMITGNLKSRLCDMGYNCTLSIPTVVRGDQIAVSAKSATISVADEFSFEGMGDRLSVKVFATI